MTFDTGAPEFGLQDLKIATWDGDGTYTDETDVPSAQMYGVNIQTTNAQLEGDDVITATAAKATSAQVQFRFGSVSLPVLDIITGGAIESSGGTTQQWLDVAGRNFPYFGICGRADGAEDGDTHLFVPKCKVMEGFQLRFEYGNFSIPELTCMAVPDGNFLDGDSNPVIMVPVKHAAATTIALPPADYS